MIDPPWSNLPDQRINFLLFSFTWVKLMLDPPAYQTEEKAVHGIQLYILSSFIIQPYILSFVVEQLDRSVMHLFLQKISVNFFIIVV